MHKQIDVIPRTFCIFLQLINQPNSAMLRFLLVALFFCLTSTLFSQSYTESPIPSEWITTPEKTDYQQTSTHADVMQMLKSLAEADERMHLLEMGKSPEGKSIPLMVLNGTEIPIEKLAEADFPTLYMQGNIHAGEVEGKEALLILLREYAMGMHSEWTDGRVVLINPIYNTDSNDKMEQGIRPSQEDSPVKVGQRPNSQGLDLNRDGVKAEANETKALYEMLNTWDPDLLVDFHTTNGTWHGYRLTWAPAYHTAGDSTLFNYGWYQMLPAITQSVKENYGLHFGPYGWYNLREGWPPKYIQTYNHHPRYLVNMMGLRNRMGILSETFAHDRFYHRIHAAYAFGKEILDYFAANGDQIQQLNKQADEKATMATGSSRGVRFEKVPLPETFNLRTYDYLATENKDGSLEYVRSGEIVTYDGVENYSAFKATEFETVPEAYYLPADLNKVAQDLQMHGVKMEKLDQALQTSASAFFLEGWTQSERIFQKHQRIETVDGDWQSYQSTSLKEGGWVVPMNQPLAYVAFYLLEPQSDDGLVSWNFLDAWLKKNSELPILRIKLP